MNNTISIMQRDTQLQNLIAFEYLINEIANRLFIDHYNDVTHCKNLMSKLKVNITALLKYFLLYQIHRLLFRMYYLQR